MRANPGGQISPDQVIGRDDLIRRLWRILGRQSLVLTAERRMGKTSVIKKMTAEAPDRTLPIYRDLEAIQTPIEFVESVFTDVENYLSTRTRVAERARRFLGQFTGVQVSGVKLPDVVAPHWKSLLSNVIADLAEHRDQQIILFWDELPLMLYNIRQHSGEDSAMEILNTLRSLRQTHDNLRMVYTGSVGLHNVLFSLRLAKYANDPTNDMAQVDVEPLDLNYAEELARKLLLGEALAAADPDVPKTIATLVDRTPYYIHHVVDTVAQLGLAPQRNIVEQVVTSAIIDPQDPWHLRYYRERLDIYYSPEFLLLALACLDSVAVSAGRIDFDTLFNDIKSQLPTEDKEAILEVLDLVKRDHYISQHEDGTYSFKHQLIKRYWRLHRGLKSD